MKSKMQMIGSIARTVIGCALFALGFNIFLVPHDLNAGGITGLSMIAVRLLNTGSIGLLSALINLPLFVLGWWKLGKRFFFGSLLGMALSSVFIDLFSGIVIVETEPLIGALYGGIACGAGLGMVFAAGFSTGGSDIIVRLLKYKWQHMPIGVINMLFDIGVAGLTGLIFNDLSKALYSFIAIFLTGQVIDAVVYRFDYSKVALIITKEYEAVAKQIGLRLDRGATFLHGEGSYSGTETRVILTAVKKQQLAELKALVVEIDPNAFIIVQEAHQVLGDGFSRYSKDAL